MRGLSYYINVIVSKYNTVKNINIQVKLTHVYL